jgi:hypothetical protein
MRDLPQHSRCDSTCLASLLFAVALVRTNEAFLLTAVLPVAPAVLAAIHSRGLSDGGRRRPVGDNGDDSEQEGLAREHV